MVARPRGQVLAAGATRAVATDSDSMIFLRSSHLPDRRGTVEDQQPGPHRVAIGHMDPGICHFSRYPPTCQNGKHDLSDTKTSSNEGCYFLSTFCDHHLERFRTGLHNFLYFDLDLSPFAQLGPKRRLMTKPSLLADTSSPLPLSAWAFLLRTFRDTDQPERRRFLVDLFLLVARGLRNASPAADPAESALFL